MSKSLPRKRKTAQEKREAEAARVIGSFLRYWSGLKSSRRGIEKLCALDDVSAVAICSNLNFQAKMSILVSLCLLYLDEQRKKRKDSIRRVFARCLEINAQWRNVVVHNSYLLQKDGGLRFARMFAKREVKIVKFTRTSEEFESMEFLIVKLAQLIETIVDAADKYRIRYKNNEVAPTPEV